MILTGTLDRFLICAILPHVRRSKCLQCPAPACASRLRQLHPATIDSNQLETPQNQHLRTTSAFCRVLPAIARPQLLYKQHLQKNRGEGAPTCAATKKVGLKCYHFVPRGKRAWDERTDTGWGED